MKYKNLLVVLAFLISVGSTAMGEFDIKVGDSIDQVVKSLGVPSGKANMGTQAIYFYDGGDIVFEKGKVTKVPKNYAASAQQKQKERAKKTLHDLSDLPTLPKAIPAFYYNNILEGLNDTVLSVKFDGKDFSVYNELDIFGEVDGFTLSPSDVRQFVSLMEKYQKWRIKALSTGVTVQKEIGTLPVEIFWTSSDEWHFNFHSSVNCSFFSQNEKRHQMTMSFKRVSSSSNEYITHHLQTIYFDPEGVVLFLKAFSRSNIDAKVAEHNRQKQIESQFQ